MEELRKEFEKRTGITPVWKDEREHFDCDYVDGLEREIALLRQKLSEKQVTEKELNKFEDKMREGRFCYTSSDLIRDIVRHYHLIPKE
jgi:hypothetical protein